MKTNLLLLGNSFSKFQPLLSKNTVDNLFYEGFPTILNLKKMKRTIGVVLIFIGFALAVITKIGPSKETSWMFAYGIWPLLALASALLIPGFILYNKRR